MSVIYKDIDQLLQKPVVTGSEKIPVSDTQYLTTGQIASSIFVDVEEDGLYIVDGYLNIGSRLDATEQTSNKVTSISSSSTDTQYPSAKCVYDIVGDIETLLAAL